MFRYFICTMPSRKLIMMEPYSEVLQAFSPPQNLHKNILNYFSNLFFCSY